MRSEPGGTRGIAGRDHHPLSDDVTTEGFGCGKVGSDPDHSITGRLARYEAKRSHIIWLYVQRKELGAWADLLSIRKSVCVPGNQEFRAGMGGPTISIPNCSASAGMSEVGRPIMAGMNCSNPAGVSRTTILAGAVSKFRNACGLPLGIAANPPGPVRNCWPAQMKSTVPSRTKRTSSPSTCRAMRRARASTAIWGLEATRNRHSPRLRRRHRPPANPRPKVATLAEAREARPFLRNYEVPFAAK